MSVHLFCMMWNLGWLWRQCRGYGFHLDLIWGTPSYFAFLRWHQRSSRLVTGFLGSLEFHQAKPNSLHVCLGIWNCYACRAGESGLICQGGGSHMGFLELWQELLVYSRVTAGMAIRNSSLFGQVRTPVYLSWTPQESKLGLAAQYGLFWRWGG